MRRLIFLDLDDTLFQTLPKCPADTALHPAAYAATGHAHSFMTARQRALWQWLADQSTLIPTTAREYAALRRVDLPFTSWHIIDYGGVILAPDGTPDAAWLADMTAHSFASLDLLNVVLDQVLTFSARAGLAIRARWITDFDIPFYIVAKYCDERVSDLDRLQDQLVAPWVAHHSDRYRLHRNGNNLAIIPRWLGKEYAVRYVMDQFKRHDDDLLTIGIGDSVIDAAFMAECDYAITPRSSQLYAATLARCFL